MAAPSRREEAPVDLGTFEAAYRRHFPFVWRALRRLGVPERDLSDAAQDVFVVVHRGFATFEARARFTTWLYAICLRVASDRRRSAAARYEVFADAEPAKAAPSSDATLGERRMLLERALASMPLEQRSVFTLFELEGMTGEEIAALCDIPVATVHSRLRLARESFRRVLRRERARETFDLVRMGEET